MAKYTITIRSLINNNFDFKMTEYPIYDESYRQILNNKILNHYYESEIGFETASLFRFYLNNKLNEIMPYYNILYEKQLSLIPVLDNNINLTENFTSKDNTITSTTSSSNSESNGTNKHDNLFQDTPQGKISYNELENQTWATNFTQDKNTNNNTINDNSSTNGTSTNTNDYIKQLIGKSGGKYNIDILNDIKNNIINIDLMIINELEDLFMGLF